MKHTQSGFTLIELMIVVAIIGILTAVSVPAYKDHIQRAQGASALSSLESDKLKINEAYAIEGTFPTSPITKTNGQVTISLTPTESNNVLTWQCTTSGAAFTGCNKN